jgi:hypothetical protein
MHSLNPPCERTDSAIARRTSGGRLQHISWDALNIQLIALDSLV